MNCKLCMETSSIQYSSVVVAVKEGARKGMKATGMDDWFVNAMR